MPLKQLCALLGLLLFLSACADKATPPSMPSAQEQPVIETARRAVAQNEDWAARAEFQVKRSGGVWNVTARRVEHAEAVGNLRYVPWGRREMVIDDTGKVLSYGTGK